MSDALLDIAGVVTNALYIGYFISAWITERHGTLGHLIKACQRYWTALALAVVAFVLDLLSIPGDSAWWAAMSGLTCAVVLVCAVLAERVRDLKVIEEQNRDLGWHL